MKNACLILTNRSGVISEIETGAIACFENAGYEFSQVNIFRKYDERLFSLAIEDCKRIADNVIVLVEGYALDLLAEVAEQAFGKEFFRTATNGAGILTDADKTLFLLPYDNLKYISEICLPYLSNKYGNRTGCIVFRCIGAEMERLGELLERARRMAGNRVSIRHERLFGEHILRIFYDENTPRMLTDDLVRFFAKELDDNLYALEDIPIEKQLVNLLRLRRKKLAVAESFTGGGVSKKIVSVPGASEVFMEGLNTYAESSKVNRLGVSDFTLHTYGAVSEQTAYEMAAGLLEQGGCDISIATTGLAGPKDDGSGLPIGTCYFAVGLDNNVYVYRYLLKGDRQEITETAIQYALFLAYKQLKNM